MPPSKLENSAPSGSHRVASRARTVQTPHGPCRYTVYGAVQMEGLMANGWSVAAAECYV